jgi:hypothetical protein
MTRFLNGPFLAGIEVPLAAFKNGLMRVNWVQPLIRESVRVIDSNGEKS